MIVHNLINQKYNYLPTLRFKKNALSCVTCSEEDLSVICCNLIKKNMQNKKKCAVQANGNFIFSTVLKMFFMYHTFTS